MVRRRVYKRKPKPYRKRKLGKKMLKYTRRYSMFTPKAHLPFGQSQKVNHRYLASSQMQTAAGAAAVHTFQVNSLYDPDYTGVGHQPIGYDQLTALFQAYTVIGVRASIKVWNRDSDEFVGFAIYFSEHGNPMSVGIQALLEQGALKYTIIPPAGVNPQVKTLTASVSVKKFFKVNNIMDDEESRGTTGSSPSRPLFMHIIMWQPDGGLTSAGGSYYLTLDQTAIWNRPLTISPS